jgi:phospholipid/cholesterol/gamma-HCH transport system substrate-binding protein
MKSRAKEFWVGCLVLLAVALVLVFGWLMGVVGSFTREVRYSVEYGFAGGVEVGSPVRVSGVKVGKVERIEFLPQNVASKREDRATLRLVVTVTPVAALAVREDSKFFINMAGIIGERYIEISPGSANQGVLAPGSTVRGVDPPRIDQLLSQGYGVFGQIQDFLEENQQTMTDFLNQMRRLITDLNGLMRGQDRKKIVVLVDNLNEITSDVKGMTRSLRQARAQHFFDQLVELIDRAHQVDKPALKKFLQEEGIRAHIF